VLEVDRLTTRYGAITALRAASLRVGEGEVVALIGPNGAGKTTLLGSIAGMFRPSEGRVVLSGRDITRRSPETVLKAGLALVPEHRRIFRDLTVHENLLLGGITVRAPARRARAGQMEERVPVLGAKREVQAGFLSGGEAQQLAIARALMASPRLLLMDEPSLGLAPALVDVVMRLIGELQAEGTTVLVVEQNATKVLAVSDRAYVMRTGEIVEEGPAAALLARPDLFAAYLGAP
jgi:branched-chain amino acid transport system ATP-binding protein